MCQMMWSISVGPSGLSRLHRYMEVAVEMFGGVHGQVTGRMSLLGPLGVGILLLVTVLLYFRRRQRAHLYERIAVGVGNEDVVMTRSEMVTRSNEKA